MPEPIPAPIVVRMTKPADQPAELQPGPYHFTATKTYKISPIEITVVTADESSHVPVPEKPCGCGGGSSGLPIDAIIGAIMQAVASMKAEDDHDDRPLDMDK